MMRLIKFIMILKQFEIEKTWKQYIVFQYEFWNITLIFYRHIVYNVFGQTLW
jgi:hypothetical protein